MVVLTLKRYKVIVLTLKRCKVLELKTVLSKPPSPTVSSPFLFKEARTAHAKH